ncbi:hypothetical protein [Glacieibacterium sp.]|uniref:hypothetical protein n=1 Tax=Glacieibacterium sp. TaxID=2860237 RepID=UPI003AFFB404
MSGAGGLGRTGGRRRWPRYLLGALALLVLLVILAAGLFWWRTARRGSTGDCSSRV